MTVKELQEALQQLVDSGAARADDLVVLSKDSEGNQFSPVPEDPFGVGFYQQHNSWCGDFIDTSDPEAPQDAPRCVAIFPTN